MPVTVKEIRFARPRTWLVRNKYVTDSPWQEVEAYSDKEACEKSGIPFDECWPRLKGTSLLGNPVDLSKNMLYQMRPAAPFEGPPLPQGLNIRWPWRKP